jgi:predicted amidophosphoribosyltransferase
VPPAPGRRPGQHLATLLARSVARRHRLPFQPRLLVPTRFPAEQHLLGAADRERNVDELFRCRARCAGTVVLVDDLITSGATARAAARALHAAGAARVVLACLARTPRADDPDPPADEVDGEAAPAPSFW